MMFEGVLITSLILICFFIPFILYNLSVYILPFIIAITMNVYTLSYAYIAPNFIDVKGNALIIAVNSLEMFSQFLMALALLIFFPSGKRTKKGKIDKRYAKQNEENNSSANLGLFMCFLIGLPSYGLVWVIKEFNLLSYLP
ncbi:hypothetical protein BMT54_07380 [Pasteurellaceae bacterium 15-036681]|nr:hypothetical protein BMT54_07380 [Pasteurellaceae bacterium 15-036681]